MFEITVMIGIVVGLSQIGKTIGLQTKYVPLLNLTLGIVLGALFFGRRYQNKCISRNHHWIISKWII